MSRRSLLLVPCLAFLVSRPPPAIAWDITTLDAASDAGRFCRIETRGINLHVVYVRHDTLFTLTSVAGSWGLPEPIATGVSGECDIVATSTATRACYRLAGLGALGYAGPERTPNWSLASLPSTSDDLGRFVRLIELPSGELAVTCQNTTQSSLVAFTADSGGSWTGPITIDPGPSRGTACDLASRAGSGLVFTQRDAAEGALLYADSALEPLQNFVTSTLDDGGQDVGRYVRLLDRPGSELAVACQNTTQSSLAAFTADSGGSWTGPITIDPGPSRGTACDLASRSGSGLIFTQRDAAEGALLYADPGLVPSPWQRSTIASEDDSGRRVSLAIGASGRPVCAYYNFTPTGFGQVLLGVQQPDSSWLTATVVPTLGTSAIDRVDFAVTQTDSGTFHLSFHEPYLGYLYEVTTDGSSVHPTAVAEFGTNESIELLLDFPNPIRGPTLFRFALPRAAPVSLRIYDALGRRVRTLLESEMQLAGPHEVFWNGYGTRGRPVASGVYFCQLVVGESVRVQRLVVVR